MTRDEAISWLEKIIEKYIHGGDDEFDSKREEALRMAISALEQEPCDDAISREELLKAIDTWDKFGVDDTNSLFRLDNLSLPHYVPYIHYDDVIKCIKGMPPVTPSRRTGHWLRVTTVKPKDYCNRCSECGYEQFYAERYNYCPNCGADMRGDAE